MIDSTKILMDFIDQYWYLLLIAAGFVILFIFIIKRTAGKKFKVLDRSAVERKKFIERNKLNKPDNEKFLYRGKTFYGKLLSLRKDEIEVKKTKDDPGQKVAILNIGCKPTLFGLRWPIGSPGAKELCVIMGIDSLIFDKDNVILKEEIPTHEIFGIYYDETLENRLVEFIKNDYVVRTSFEDAMSVFYVKAMEQSTFDPEHAHATQNKQLDIENEKEKRKVAQS